MKKILFAAVAVLVSVASYGQQNTVITKFAGENLRGIIVSGAFDVRISQGNETFAKVEVREDLASKVTIEKTDEGFVRLNYGTDVGKFFKGKARPFVTIVVKELCNLNVSGVSVLIGKGEFSASEQCAVLTGGTASVNFIHVTAPKVTMDIQGSSVVDDFTIHTPSARMDVGGTAKATVKGSADLATVNTSGTAGLDMLNLKCPMIKAVTTGFSVIKANVSGTADVTSGGTSTFKYTGQGKVTGPAKTL